MNKYTEHSFYEQKISPYIFLGRCFEVKDFLTLVFILKECNEWKEKLIWKYREQGYEFYDLSVIPDGDRVNYRICLVERSELKVAPQTQTADTISPNLHGKAVCFSE